MKATTGAATGGAVGGLTGLLVGLGALAIPGIGPCDAGAGYCYSLSTAFPGGRLVLPLVVCLVQLALGIPEDELVVYNLRLSQGDYLV